MKAVNLVSIMMINFDTFHIKYSNGFFDLVSYKEAKKIALNNDFTWSYRI